MRKRIAVNACDRGAPAPRVRRRPATPPACRQAPRPSPEVLEEYFRGLDAFEAGESTTDFQRLLDAGIDLPEPASLSCAEVSAKLWEVVGGVAALRVFLSSTDHLSDRDLYTVLWSRVLRQEIEALPGELGVWHVDLVSGGGEEATHLYLRHYADERERRQWAAEFPDGPIPAHEDPPFDRDRKLPKP